MDFATFLELGDLFPKPRVPGPVWRGGVDLLGRPHRFAQIENPLGLAELSRGRGCRGPLGRGNRRRAGGLLAFAGVAPNTGSPFQAHVSSGLLGGLPGAMGSTGAFTPFAVHLGQIAGNKKPSSRAGRCRVGSWGVRWRAWPGGA